MAESFDPYYVWLGIPPEEQPADHYRLLGLRKFEANAAVIDNAADRAMGHLRSVAVGKHAADAQRLLNELSAARVCLLNADARGRYDAELRAKQSPQNAGPGAPRARFTPPPGPPSPSAARPVPLPAQPARPAATIAASPTPSEAATVSTGRSVVVARRNSNPAWVAPLVSFVSVVAIGLIGYAMMSGKNNDREESADRVAEAKNDGSKRPNIPPSPPSKQVDPPLPRGNNVVSGPNQGTSTAKPVPEIPTKSPDAPKTPADLPPAENVEETPDETKPKSDGTLRDLIEGNDPASPESTLPDTPPPDSSEPPGDFSSVAERIAVPAAGEIEARKVQIRDLFRTALASEKPAELIAAAKTLIEHARDTKDDPVGKYALLDEALTLATKNGDVLVAREAATEMLTYYDVDPLKLKADALIALGRSPLVPEMRKIFFQNAWPVIKDLMHGDRYDEVLRLTGMLLPIAQTHKAKQLIQDIKDVERDARESRDAFVPLAQMFERLRKSADDKEASAAVGKFRAFVCGDWQRGLPLLAAGGDAELAKLAADDLAAPSDAKQQLALGDAWRAVSAKRDDKRQEIEVSERAAHWYTLARANLTGLDAAKVVQSLKELPRKPRHHVDAVKYGAHWYKLINEKVTWQEAKRQCEAMGGYLVCVETKEEANFVFRLARPAINDEAWCWVGATDEQSEGDFRWINGSPFVNVAWWPQQPDNRGGSENYVVIAPKGFNDANADQLSVFVCEWEN